MPTSTIPHPTTPEAARAILSDLEARRRSEVERIAELEDRTERLSYAAAIGHREPRAQLDRLTKEIIAGQTGLRQLDAAIAEGRRRVQQADAAQRRADLRARAEQAQELLAGLDEIGRSLDASLKEFAAKVTQFTDIGNEIRRLGFSFPNRDLQRANLSRAIDSQLWQLHLSSRPVPPSQRVGIAELIEHWRNMMQARIAEQVGGEEEAA